MLAAAIASLLAGCVAEPSGSDEMSETPDHSLSEKLAVTDSELGTVELSQGEQGAALAALNLFDSGEFTSTAGIGGRSEDRVLDVSCPGHRRTGADLIKLDGGGSCSVVGWASSDEGDCRVRIHLGIPSFGRVKCLWNVYADLLGVMSYTAANTSSAQQNTVDTAFTDLADGTQIDVGTCRLPGATASGDTYLRLIGPSGQTAALNDDSCGLSSFMTFTVPPNGAGTYRLKAGCFSQGSCSGTVVWHIR